MRNDSNGQMILLSALAACICLLTLVAILSSVRQTAPDNIETLTGDVFENVLWAQDQGLGQTGLLPYERPADQRAQTIIDFKRNIAKVTESLADNMLSRGIAYRFSLNESLASGFAAESSGEYESASGVIYREENGSVKICGCGYDVLLKDGSVTYELSRMEAWA